MGRTNNFILITVSFTVIMILLFVIVCIVLRPHKGEKEEDNSKRRKKLWTHIVYIEVNHKNERNVIVSHGLFNQLYSLFIAVHAANSLDRDLVVSGFHVHYMDTTHNVPLSQVIDLGSLGVPTTDWDQNKEPKASQILETPPNVFEVLQQKNMNNDLEVGCLFNVSPPNHKKDRHIQRLRFHPFFYNIVSEFLGLHPKYQVVHYRMESDFSTYFHRMFGFDNVEECRIQMRQQYRKAMKKMFSPNIPTLVVSHYYKDPQQPRDADLQWTNLIHFKTTDQQKEKIYQHLNMPASLEMREVDAILDFILSTSSNVVGFVGCENSTFSEAVSLGLKKNKCFMIKFAKA